jgi:hypothetical protein
MPIQVRFINFVGCIWNWKVIFRAVSGQRKLTIGGILMASSIGPLLEAAMDKLNRATSEEAAIALTAEFGNEEPGVKLPIVVQLPPTVMAPTSVSWSEYREIVQQKLRPFETFMKQTMGLSPVPLLAANALQVSASLEQIQILSKAQDHVGEIRELELDPLIQLTTMDDAVQDIELNTYRQNHPGLTTGKGVKVAVLDSGIDTLHPHLQVADSVETCGEDINIPGEHGTHCAGSIASRDAIFPGVAPDVTLLNIKVLRANGTGRHTFITKGIDEALDREAQILSMSVGFNHLPTWSAGGHGWSCLDGRCPLCTAVDNAVAQNVLVVVAAGNEHERAEALRLFNFGNAFDTELGCPGQARQALTVGALTKRTFLPASFSSRGPTSYSQSKPDIAAPGVNITSTIPAPRDAQGSLVPNPSRASLFGRKSGTSMATPIIAGTAALLIEQRLTASESVRPADLRQMLLTRGSVPLGLPLTVVGAGRLSLRNL